MLVGGYCYIKSLNKSSLVKLDIFCRSRNDSIFTQEDKIRLAITLLKENPSLHTSNDVDYAHEVSFYGRSSTYQLQFVYIEPVNQLKQTRVLPGIKLCRRLFGIDYSKQLLKV